MMRIANSFRIKATAFKCSRKILFNFANLRITDDNIWRTVSRYFCLSKTYGEDRFKTKRITMSKIRQLIYIYIYILSIIIIFISYNLMLFIVLYLYIYRYIYI